MDLITTAEISKLLDLQRFGIFEKLLLKIFNRVFCVRQINAIYHQYCHLVGEDFVTAILNELGISFNLTAEALLQVPRQGSFIAIANHPFGMLDGLILLKMLLPIRPDFKLMASFLLQRAAPLQQQIITVNPFVDQRRRFFSSVNGYRQVWQWLRTGHGIGVFPSGTVSFHKDCAGQVVEQPWQHNLIKLIQKSNAPVLPLFFHGSNANSFYRCARYSTFWKNAKIPSLILKQQQQTIGVSVGKLITSNKMAPLSVIELSNYLRNKVMLLADRAE